MKAKVRRRKRTVYPSDVGGVKVEMYAIHIDMDEFYEGAIVEKSAAADEVVRKYGEFVSMDRDKERVTFLYRTEEERAIAFCRVKNVFPSARYASGAAFVDADILALLEEKK